MSEPNNRVSTGRSTEHGYRVEARDANFNHANPVVLYDGILGPDWREIRFARGHDPAGIPDELYGQKDKHDLLAHESALALAWTLVAQHRLQRVEVRLVRYVLETTYSCARLGVVDMPIIRNSLFQAVKLVDSDVAPPAEAVKAQAGQF